MCGICGIVNFDNRRISEEILKKMTRVIKHRGPDDEGYYINAKCKMPASSADRQNVKCNIGLGVKRLSIIDLETGHQPIHNEDETIWIVLNGEIYNFKDLREDL